VVKYHKRSLEFRSYNLAVPAGVETSGDLITCSTYMLQSIYICIKCTCTYKCVHGTKCKRLHGALMRCCNLIMLHLASGPTIKVELYKHTHFVKKKKGEQNLAIVKSIRVSAYNCSRRQCATCEVYVEIRHCQRCSRYSSTCSPKTNVQPGEQASGTQTTSVGDTLRSGLHVGRS